MIVSDRPPDALYLRGWEERLHHSLVLRQGPVAGVARLAFRVRSEADLDALAADFAGARVRDCRRRRRAPGQGRRSTCAIPSGSRSRSSARWASSTRSCSASTCSTARRSRASTTSTCTRPTSRPPSRSGRRSASAAPSTSRPTAPDERITGAWLTRKPTVHDVALTAGRGPRLHHLGFAVPGHRRRACARATSSPPPATPRAIERGPGRHGVSNAFFVYLRDPSGHRIELYACDYYTGDPDHKPLRWSAADASCRSFWGARAPDRWYDESSVVLGPDGHPFAARPTPTSTSATRSAPRSRSSVEPTPRVRLRRLARLPDRYAAAFVRFGPAPRRSPGSRRGRGAIARTNAARCSCASGGAS